MRGVTSFCRFWRLGSGGYHALLQFFRSSAWSLDALIVCWTTFVLSQNETVRIQGRAVIFGDHTCVPKDDRRMPYMVTLHQKSESQSKPSYFHGHYGGAIGLLIRSMASPFCLPLSLGIHQGLVHIGKKVTQKKAKRLWEPGSLKWRSILPSDTICGASLYWMLFSPNAAVFKLAASLWSLKLKCPLVTLIVKAKKNCVAYFEAVKPHKGKRGRPPKYGEKVKLIELFDQSHLFSKIRCSVYGKIEEVRITSADLLWKPTGALIRFVLAVTNRRPIVLICSDIQQDPCCRSRIVLCEGAD